LLEVGEGLPEFCHYGLSFRRGCLYYVPFAKYFQVIHCEVICCLTPVIGVILENLGFAQLIRKFPASFGAPKV
jgi:hypothetical protein